VLKFNIKRQMFGNPFGRDAKPRESRAEERALGNRIVTIAGSAEEQRSEIKKRKKIKEVLTCFRHFGYKRRSIPKFKLHYFITVHEKEIHFAIRVF
jgi:hypothetical protein